MLPEIDGMEILDRLFEPLFEPLFRRETSRAESPHLGIGLTLSRDAALAMHATLTADRPDQETIRFTLSLPSP
jgi:signal transduction histidine kinase